jgi:histidine triad (HIT) family protein
MTDCIFCRIAAGDAPASVVYADDIFLAFMDLHPLRPGHVLVIPRRHAVFLSDLPAETQRHLFALGCRILAAQRRAGIPLEGAQVLINDGPASGQHVPHVHLHLIPRTKGDRLKVAAGMLARLFNRFGASEDRVRLDAVAARIRAAL